MSAVVFRKARLEDVPAIIALLADDVRGKGREIPGVPLDPRYYRAFEAMEAMPGCCQLVGVAGEAIIACAQLIITPGLSNLGATRATIEGVRVAAGLRRQGFGELLVGHMVQLARQAGCATLRLTTDKSRRDAQRFYARLGFENSHEGFKLNLN